MARDRRSLSFGLLAPVVALSLAGPAAVWPQKTSIRVRVVNTTGDDIRAVYVCPTGAAKWGPNLLVDPNAPSKAPRVLGAGKALALTFSGDCGLYDVRLVAPGGKEYMEEELSFCEDDDVLTIGGGALTKATAKGSEK
jgi:hypothetical protein